MTTSYSPVKLVFPKAPPVSGDNIIIIDGGGPDTEFASDGTVLRSSVEVNTPTAGAGRGAWPIAGGGGTLNASGTGPGRFYRSKAKGAPSGVLAPGVIGFRAARDGAEVSINDYAVYRGVVYLQKKFGADSIDGVLGPLTDATIKTWQTSQGLVADGVFGPKTAKRFLTPLVHQAARSTNQTRAGDLAAITIGTISYESGWDHSAVGRQDPRDIGIAQIHVPMHTNVSVDDAFDPDIAIPWMTGFINWNLTRMDNNVRDAVAAYNLGVGGARRWVEAGRPDLWQPVGSTSPRNVKTYIDSILAVTA